MPCAWSERFKRESCGEWTEESAAADTVQARDDREVGVKIEVWGGGVRLLSSGRIARLHALEDEAQEAAPGPGWRDAGVPHD